MNNHRSDKHQKNPSQIDLGQYPIIVLDTNVLMGAGTDPFSTFSNSHIVIPLSVVASLERHRSDSGLGSACRTALNYIEGLRSAKPSKKIEKEFTDNDGLDSFQDESTIVSIATEEQSHRSYSQSDSTSEAVLDQLIKLKNTKCYAQCNITLVSNSLRMRLLANHHGIASMPYIGRAQPFTGELSLSLLKGTVKDIVTTSIGERDADEALAKHCRENSIKEPSHAVVTVNDAYGNRGKVIFSNGHFKEINYEITAGNVRPKKAFDQVVALDYLLNPSIEAVSLGGVAGSGKSYLALAAGMSQVKSGRYDSIVVIRSMYSVDRQDVGFLPGGLDDKMAPWAKAIWDNVEQIDKTNGYKSKARTMVNPQTGEPMVVHDNAQSRHVDDITIEPVTYLRGRTYARTFVIVDDAQSLDRSTILDIITRIGEGSKLVLTYDLTQQDNPFISPGTSVATVVADLVDEPMFAHISFTTSIRSNLAQIAANLLEEDTAM